MRLTLSLETLAANPYRRQILRTNHPFQFSWSEIQCFGFDSTKTDLLRVSLGNSVDSKLSF